MSDLKNSPYKNAAGVIGHPGAPRGGGGSGGGSAVGSPLADRTLANGLIHPEAPAALTWSPQQIADPSLYQRAKCIYQVLDQTEELWPAAVFEETGYQLKGVLQSLIPGLLQMLAVVGLSTVGGAAVGGFIGAFFGGVGAVPGAVVGAQLGAELSTAILTWLGLGFLIVAIGDGLGELAFMVSNAFSIAWHAAENPQDKKLRVNQAARELARAIAVLVRLILQGILAYVLKNAGMATARAGVSTVRSATTAGVKATAETSVAEVAGLIRKSKLPDEFALWLEKNWDDLARNPRLKKTEVAKPPVNNSMSSSTSGSAVTPSEAAGGAGRSGASGEASAPAKSEAGSAKSTEPACPVGSNCSKAGEPISMVTGEEMLEKVDFTWDGPLPLEWRRFYRSGQSDIDRQLGYGWLTPLDECLEIGERATFCNADGQRIDLPLPAPGAFSINMPEQLRLYRENGQYRIVDPSGLAKTFAGSQGRCPVRAWHNSQGQSLYFHRDANGDVERISASWNKHLLLERQGRRIVAIRPGKRVGSGFEAAGEPLVSYLYSDAGDLIGARDRLEQGETYAYQNHVIARRTLPSGFNFYFEWDQDTPQGKCLHNWGDNGVYDYHFEWLPDGVSHAIDSRGGVAIYRHDPQGLLLSERSPEGRETRHSYNADNQLAQTVGPDGGITRFSYDKEGRLIGVSDALGFSQRVKYDKQGNPVELIDALDQRWLRRYDASGRLEETVAANGAVTQYQYNAQGVPVRITDALGRTRSLLWDEQLRLVGEIGFDGIKTRYQYDDDDRIVAIIDQDKRTTRYGYDAAGRVTAVQHADGSTVQLRYNAAGLLTHYLDGLGNTTEYRYDDGLSQPTARIDPLGHEMRYRYDSERNLIGLINPKGETYSLNYDRDENLIEEIGFDGRIQRYRYNAAGALEAYLQPGADGDWSITRFERDRLGRLLKKHAADGSLSQYGYDPLGRLQLAKNADSLVLLGYNALGQINQENQNGAIVRHKYDLLGRRIYTETPDRHRIDYRFGERYLDSIEFDGQTLTSHRYDELGREIGRSQGQLNSDYDYDPLGRLLRQRAALKGQAVLIGRQYNYDAAGKLRELDDLRQGRSQYHYDPAARLIRSEGLSPESFVHDPAGNLLGASAEGGRIEGDRLLMMGDRHYAYDAAGNLIEEKRGKASQIVTRYQYDADNRLIRAETPQGTAQYRYDALGRRIAKHTAQGETRFQYDGPRLLAETDSQRHRTYLFEPGSFRPLALHEQHNSQASGSIYHYHLDHLGTPRELTDSQGKIVWSARYRAYGNLALADVEEIENPLRFQGQYYDAETGLHYNLNRYYDPNAGRFIHQDPIGLQGGSNVYRYVPNPVNWVDPLGWISENATGYNVYGLFDRGASSPYYVGITNDLDRRRVEHISSERLSGGSEIRLLEKDVTYGQSRGYEQAYIEHYETKTGVIGQDISATNRGNKVNSFDHNSISRDPTRQFNFETNYQEKMKTLKGDCG